MTNDVEKTLAAAIRKLQAYERRECFNPERPDLKATEAQLEVLKDTETLHHYIISGNRAGKSQLGGRIVSWWFDDCHPYAVRPSEWGTGSITILVVGRVGEQVESELWEKKIKPYLEPGTYKEIRTGQALQRVIHKNNGNRILFFSHHNANEAREKVQAFTAHIVWLDEMPNSVGLFTELQLRVQSNRGRFYATFTPLIRNEEIKSLIESARAPFARKYKLSMLDNPLHKGREEEILASFEGVSNSERNARLYGDWFIGDLAVYPFDSEKHVEAPEGYHASWRHVETVDPAASGKFGFVLVAEQPRTGKWYVVRSDYIPGQAPTDLLDEIETRTDNLNIINRVCDSANSWYIKEAAKRKRYYVGANKDKRKLELITGLKQALVDGWLKIAPWCEEIQRELSTCQWSETKEDTIVNAKAYHTGDALQYFVDVRPKPMATPVNMAYNEWLNKEDDKRRATEPKVSHTITTQRQRLRANKRWR